MPWAAAAAVAGAAITSSATSSAAKKQADATKSGMDAQNAQYAQTRQDQTPYRLSGGAALRQYNTLLGIDAGPNQSADTFDSRAYLAANPDVAKDRVYGTNPYQHYLDYGKNEGRQAYWTPQATDPNNGPASADFGSYAKPPTQDEVQLDPGYQFGLQQGQQALDRKTAAAGGRISGAALKAASEYGTDYGTTGYSTAYNRVNQARSDRLNRLAALAGIGQTSVQQTGTAGAGTANQISSMTTAQGNASGAAQIAQGNIWGNAGNQLAALYGRNSTTTAPTQSYQPSAYSSTGGDTYYGTGQNWGV